MCKYSPSLPLIAVGRTTGRPPYVRKDESLFLLVAQVEQRLRNGHSMSFLHQEPSQQQRREASPAFSFRTFVVSGHAHTRSVANKIEELIHDHNNELILESNDDDADCFNNCYCSPKDVRQTLAV